MASDNKVMFKPGPPQLDDRMTVSRCQLPYRSLHFVGSLKKCGGADSDSRRWLLQKPSLSVGDATRGRHDDSLNGTVPIKFVTWHDINDSVQTVRFRLRVLQGLKNVGWALCWNVFHWSRYRYNLSMIFNQYALLTLEIRRLASVALPCVKFDSS